MILSFQLFKMEAFLGLIQMDLGSIRVVSGAKMER